MDGLEVGRAPKTSQNLFRLSILIVEGALVEAKVAEDKRKLFPDAASRALDLLGRR